jgi:hypothetical protein
LSKTQGRFCKGHANDQKWKLLDQGVAVDTRAAAQPSCQARESLSEKLLQRKDPVSRGHDDLNRRPYEVADDCSHDSEKESQSMPRESQGNVPSQMFARQIGQIQPQVFGKQAGVASTTAQRLLTTGMSFPLTYFQSSHLR